MYGGLDEAKKRIAHLVRPRKLNAFEGIQDVLDLKEFRLAEESKISFQPTVSNKFISLTSLEKEVSDVSEFSGWTTHVPLSPPLTLQGQVVKGFGRGSK